MTSPTSLPAELVNKLNKLCDICEHVRDISRKISELPDDPLPGQLEQSVPSYASVLTSHTAMLKRRHWLFIVAGDTEHVKAAFLDVLLHRQFDVSLRHELVQCCRHCPVTISHGDRQHFVVCIDSMCDPVVLENWQAVEQLLKQAADGQQSISWITLHLPTDMLQEDLEFVVYPDKINDNSMDRLLDVLSNSDVMIYVADAYNLDSTEKFQIFASEMRSLRHMHQAPFVLMNCCMTVLLSRSQRESQVNETTLALLDEVGVISNLTDSTQTAGKTLDMAALLKAMNRTLVTSIESRITYHYGWLNSFVARVLYHLKAFLSQAEKTHEDRLETHRIILARLVALTQRSEAFLKALEQEVDARFNEGVELLRNHLLCEDVVQRLSTWTEEEAPDDDIWSETETAIKQRIQSRIRRELLSWERENHFFEVQRPRLIELFEHRFRGIKTHLSSVETMISRHDSQCPVSMDSSISSLHVTSDDSSAILDVSDGSTGFPGTFPFTGVRLHWTQKLALGLAAPLLVPLAVAAALLGLPILGGLAARDLVNERRSEVKVREYRADKVKYLSARTAEEVKTFARSAALDEFVASELRATFRCIGQLRDEVPRQIEADRAQILSLRDDDRQTTDLERFYRPLVEVFEHSRLLLVVYRLLYIRRDRLDVDFGQLIVQPSAEVICDSLTGTITPASWTRRLLPPFSTSAIAADRSDTSGRTSAVALKQLSRRLDTRNVEDYVLEEEAYRFQACPFIARLLATSKHNGMIYHILEPLQCSLRHHLTSSNPPMTSSHTALRPILLQLLRALDYLHDRGWVHFDLSLDGIAVDMDGRVKLTNISCRQLINISTECAVTSLFRYTHLPPEVLDRPPAAYTPAGEMYSLGIAMFEMWTGQRAYWRHLAEQTEPNIDNLQRLVDIVKSVPPTVDWTRSSESEVRTSSTDDVSEKNTEQRRIEYVWFDWMHRCWREEERISCKALLQLVEVETGGLLLNDASPSRTSVMNINETHY